MTSNLLASVTHGHGRTGHLSSLRLQVREAFLILSLFQLYSPWILSRIPCSLLKWAPFQNTFAQSAHW